MTESINSDNITRYMKLLSNAGNMFDVSDETKERIYALEKQFKEELYEFYVAAKGGSKQIDADEIFFEFDEKWNKEHPEFYDMKKLLG